MVDITIYSWFVFFTPLSRNISTYLLNFLLGFQSLSTAIYSYKNLVDHNYLLSTHPLKVGSE